MKAAALLLAIASLAFSADGEQQFARLGDFKLESGALIRDCRLGYRTFGKLSNDKSNAVLFPTWFTGSSHDLEQYFGEKPSNLVDTAQWFGIAVDALANGVSSSPSNSATEPRLAFPKITIRDMANAEYRLVTEVFGIRRLHAVMGISMGGMQAFQWAVSYPQAMERAVPIVGSPQLTSADLLLWNAEVRAIQENKDYRDGDYTTPPDLQALNLMHAFALTTPQYRATQTLRGKFPAYLKEALERDRTYDANDRMRQLEAMLGHDVGAPFGGSLARAAAEVRASMLVIVARKDPMVNPATAVEFAKLAGAALVELDGECGHLIFECQADGVVPRVTGFMRQGEPRKRRLDGLFK